MNKKEFFIDTLKGEVYAKKPVWFMRQAGRFLDSYRRLREKYDFLTMCTTPELASTVTIQPLNELDVDAMILFSDILIPLKALGARLFYEDGKTPFVDNLQIRDMSDAKINLEEIDFVKKTIENIKQEIADVALIGFAAAPFTLSCYIFGGGGDFYKLRAFIYEKPDEFKNIMQAITNLTAEYLNLQIESGVDAVQLFDSWAGIVPKDVYDKFIYPFNKKIASKLAIPSIYYVKNSVHIVNSITTLGFDCLSVDWREDLQNIYNLSKSCIQGNLDNTLLLTNRSVLEKEASRILNSTKDFPHIFNLGHGVLPQTDPKLAKFLVEFIHNF